MVLATSSFNSADDLEEVIARTLCEHPNQTLAGIMRKADIDPAYLEAVKNTLYYMILRRRCDISMRCMRGEDAFEHEEVAHFRLCNRNMEQLLFTLKDR